MAEVPANGSVLGSKLKAITTTFNCLKLSQIIRIKKNM